MSLVLYRGATKRRSAPSFRTRIVTTTPNEEVKLISTVLYADGLYSHSRWHWGDGTVTDGKAGIITHIYETPGEYFLSVWGLRHGIAFSWSLEPALAGTLSDFTKIIRLEYLDIQGSNITGVLTDLAPLSLLRTLNINAKGTEITGDIADILLFPNLREFFCHGTTGITGSLDDVFASSTNITYVALNGVVTGNISNYTNQPQLKNLASSTSNKLNGDISAIIGNTDFRILVIANGGTITYDGSATFQETMHICQLVNVGLAQADLERIIDDYYDIYSSIVANGQAILSLNGNPGSAAAATSRSAKITEMVNNGVSLSI